MDINTHTHGNWNCPYSGNRANLHDRTNIFSRVTRDYVVSPSPRRRVDAYLRKAACDERVKDHSFRSRQGHGFRGFRHEHEGRRRESARARSTNGEETSASFRTPPEDRRSFSLSLARTDRFSHTILPELTAPSVSKRVIYCISRMEKDQESEYRLRRTAFHRLNFKYFGNCSYVIERMFYFLSHFMKKVPRIDRNNNCIVRSIFFSHFESNRNQLVAKGQQTNRQETE